MELCQKKPNGVCTKLIFISAFCFLMSIFSSYALSSDKIESFSADQVEISDQGKVVNSIKMYVTPDMYRMDGMPGSGQKGLPQANITIIGFKTQDKQYFYNNDKKLFFESSMDKKTMPQGLESYENLNSTSVLGKETINGYECVKKEVVTSYNIMGMKSTNKVMLWQSDKFEFPLKTKDQDGYIMELRNIDTAKPSASLFQQPSGYKKVNNMMELMGIDLMSIVKEKMTSVDKSQGGLPDNIENLKVKDIMNKFQKAMDTSLDTKQMD